MTSCLQALSENKGKKHGGFFKKADKASRAAAQSDQQQQEQASPLPSPASVVAQASPADGAGTCSTGKSKQQSSPGWLSGILGGRKEKAKAAAAVAAAAALAADNRDVTPDVMQDHEQCQQQLEHSESQQQLQHMLHLVTLQLQELAAGMTSGTGQSCVTGADSVAGPAAAERDAGGSGAAVQGGSLLELQEMQRQQDSLPQVSILDVALAKACVIQLVHLRKAGRRQLQNASALSGA